MVHSSTLQHELNSRFPSQEKLSPLLKHSHTLIFAYYAKGIDQIVCLEIQKRLNLDDEITLKTTEHTWEAYKLFDCNSLCNLNGISL